MGVYSGGLGDFYRPKLFTDNTLYVAGCDIISTTNTSLTKPNLHYFDIAEKSYWYLVLNLPFNRVRHERRLLPGCRRAEGGAVLPGDGLEAGAVVDLGEAGRSDGTLVKDELERENHFFKLSWENHFEAL